MEFFLGDYFFWRALYMRLQSTLNSSLLKHGSRMAKRDTVNKNK